jgi:hypothetical protein
LIVQHIATVTPVYGLISWNKIANRHIFIGKTPDAEIALCNTTAMSNLTPPPEAADEAPDPSVLLAEGRLGLLRELAEIGMKLVRAIEPGAPAAADEAAGASRGRDTADAFARLSRAIRLTLALEAKTDEELRDLRAGVVRKRKKEKKRAAKRREAAAAKDAEEHEERICELVAEAAEAEIADVYEFAPRYFALRERLDNDPAYDDCSGRPVRETVERLCKDLMLSPDWSRWDGEAWIKEEGAPKRHRYSIFNQPSALPLLDDDDPDEPEAEPRPGLPQPAHDLE